MINGNLVFWVPLVSATAGKGGGELQLFGLLHRVGQLPGGVSQP